MKLMNPKLIASLALALTLSLATALPVFADHDNGNGKNRGEKHSRDLEFGVKKHSEDNDEDKNVSTPTIRNIKVKGITSFSAVVHWKTNEKTTGKIFYSTTSPVSTATGSPMVLGKGKRRENSARITSLSATTTYYAIIVATDRFGNATTSAEFSFTTKGSKRSETADTTAPEILGTFSFNISSTSAKLLWVTNEKASGTIYYGTSGPVVISSSTPHRTESDFKFFQLVGLDGLSAGTTYYYSVVVTDKSGNSGTLSGNSFTTATP